MVVYHITDQEYQHGPINSHNFDGDSYYHQGLEDGKKEINEYLSANRPEDEPSRQLCLYAFEKPEYCVFFKKKEILQGQTMHLYKCEMNSPHGHPMILVNVFQNVSEDKWEQLNAEYWHPTKSWKVMEHLVEEMQIIEEIPITGTFRSSSFLIGNNDYAEDFLKASRFL